MDATIAAHPAFGLVGPQSSGTGGGAFMLIHEADSGATRVVGWVRDRTGYQAGG